MESILTSIKKLLGITEEYEQFDDDIIMHINTVFLNLSQIGVGPEEGFSIEGADDSWPDYLPDDHKLFEAVKTYIYLKVRLLFDPPINSAVIESINRNIAEIEWRLNLAAETMSE